MIHPNTAGTTGRNPAMSHITASFSIILYPCVGSCDHVMVLYAWSRTIGGPPSEGRRRVPQPLGLKPSTMPKPARHSADVIRVAQVLQRPTGLRAEQLLPTHAHFAKCACLPVNARKTV